MMKSSLYATERLGHNLNVAGLLGICLTLLIAFFYQLVLHDLPCPLCLLQRAGLIMVGLAFMMNIRFGEKGQYYAIALLGAIGTGCIATRQVLLHIVPGSGSYGSALFGLHFYTWALLCSVGLILYVAAMLMQYRHRTEDAGEVGVSKIAGLSMLLFAVLIAANLGFIFLQCGFGECG